MAVNGKPTPIKENLMTASIIGWEEIALISILLLRMVIVLVPKLEMPMVFLTDAKEKEESKLMIRISL